MGLEAVAVKLTTLFVFGKDLLLKRPKMLDLLGVDFTVGELGSGEADAYPESSVSSELALRRLCRVGSGCKGSEFALALD